MLLERDPAVYQQLLQLKLVPTIFSFLDLEHPNNTVHLLRLIGGIVSATAAQAGGAELDELYSLGLLERLMSILSYAVENNVADFFDATLGTMHAALRVGGARNAGLLRALPSMLALLGSRDLGVCEGAVGAIKALVEQFPSETAAPVLADGSIWRALSSWKDEILLIELLEVVGAAALDATAAVAPEMLEVVAALCEMEGSEEVNSSANGVLVGLKMRALNA